jgi:hypothetical protein
MKIYYECVPCFLRQAKETLDLTSASDELKFEIMGEILELLSNEFSKDAVSNDLGTKMHHIIKNRTKNEDPYQKLKHDGNKMAISLLPEIESLLSKDDSLESYFRAAITGNLIDFSSLGLECNIQEIMSKTLHNPLIINHSPNLVKSLEEEEELLYLVDNTGEIVFDKLLIEKIKKEYNIKIILAVKEKPILNDACMEDVLEIGLDEVVDKIVSIGVDSVGIDFPLVSNEFLKIFDNAPLVISKGLGNYEGLSEKSYPNKKVFCLLNVKCQSTSHNIGAPKGSNVLFQLK